MNKIRILTFHQCINYGAILQAFALQKYLNENGTDAEIYNYENPIFKKKYTWRRYFQKQNLLIAIYNYITFPFWIVKKRKFSKFVKNNIKISEIVNCCQDDCYINKYVVGSDQVWNVKTTGYDLNYFLDFVKDNTKKYSYAASFGTSYISDSFHQKCKELLGNFEKISVRENQGKEIINKLFKTKIETVLDPTLLLTKEQWVEYASPSRKKEKYVLIYQLAYSKSLINFAKKIAKDNHCKIITIDGNPKQPIFGKYVLSAGPEDWLRLFIDADYVVTNSFHGLAFSINFNKNFYFEYLGKGLDVNSRLQNLSSIFDIESRNIKNNTNNNSYSTPEYDKINTILEKERKKSFLWIKNNLIMDGENTHDKK